MMRYTYGYSFAHGDPTKCKIRKGGRFWIIDFFVPSIGWCGQVVDTYDEAREWVIGAIAKSLEEA